MRTRGHGTLVASVRRRRERFADFGEEPRGEDEQRACF
jgi:hypothetical protein